MFTDKKFYILENKYVSTSVLWLKLSDVKRHIVRSFFILNKFAVGAHRLLAEACAEAELSRGSFKDEIGRIIAKRFH